MALLGYVATLLAPVMILNSSFWGQADSIYTAALLACLYFLLLRRNWLAFLSFGIAFAFKLQAIFLAPLLVILWFKQTYPGSISLPFRRSISLRSCLPG